MFLGGSLSKFDRRCVSRIETYLQRFEVVRNCRLASRPVFLLDQNILLFGWEESAVFYHFLKNAFHLLLVHNFELYFLHTSIKMNYRVGLNNRSLVSNAFWGRYGDTETFQKTVSWSLDLVWIMQYFSKLMKDDPQWNVKLYSGNEFDNSIKLVRGEKWQFCKCCILLLFSPAKQEENLIKKKNRPRR